MPRWFSCSLLFASACSGRISAPDRFLDASLAFPCDLPDDRIVPDLIAPRCATSGCHDQAAAASGVDLISPDAAIRMLGAPAACHGETLVDAGTPFAGYVFSKLIDERPACGARMPLGGAPLTERETGCIRRWLGTPWSVPLPSAEENTQDEEAP